MDKAKEYNKKPTPRHSPQRSGQEEPRHLLTNAIRCVATSIRNALIKPDSSHSHQGSRPKNQDPTPQTEQGLTRRAFMGRALGLIATGAAATGAVKYALSTPAADSNDDTETNDEPTINKIYPAKNQLFQQAVESQETILSTSHTQRKAYYLDDNLQIIHEAPYQPHNAKNEKEFAARTKEHGLLLPPKPRAPKNRKDMPRFRQEMTDYKIKVAQLTDQWHDQNRHSINANRSKNGEPSIKIDPNNDYPMVNVSPDYGSTFDAVWKKAQASIDTVQSEFLKAFEKTSLYKNMPEETRKKMVQICTLGQVSNESQWQPDLRSAITPPAIGPWQIREATAQDAIKKHPSKLTIVKPENTTYDLTDFKESSMVAALCYEQIYLTLKPILERVQTTYGLSDSELYTHFVIPSLVNAYHNGQGGMSKTINWFLEQFPLEKIQQELGSNPNNYGSNLYFFMAKSYFKDSGDKNFGRRSLQYVPKCYAYAKLMDQEKRQLAAQQ